MDCLWKSFLYANDDGPDFGAARGCVGCIDRTGAVRFDPVDSDAPRAEKLGGDGVGDFAARLVAGEPAAEVARTVGDGRTLCFWRGRGLWPAGDADAGLELSTRRVELCTGRGELSCAGSAVGRDQRSAAAWIASTLAFSGH